MAWMGLDEETAPFVESPESEPTPARIPAGWEAARNYHRLKKVLGDARAREGVRREAVGAVLSRARALLRHGARPRRDEDLPWTEAPGGELALDALVDEGVPPGAVEPDQVRVTVPAPRRADVVLMLDMSLSMTGEKVALVATAAAVLSLQLDPEDLAVVAFDHRATLLKRLGERVPPDTLVGRVLDVPADGFTSIEAGMRKGLTALARGRLGRRRGLLVTDGVYNVGWDPTPLARRFPRLHVVQVGAPGPDRGLCARLASNGRGPLHVLPDYDSLPSLARRLVGELFR